MSLPPRPAQAIERGQVWWVDFDPTRGAEMQKQRPAVVLTANAVNRARQTVVVIPLSTGPVPRPPVIVATPSGGTSSVAVCDQLRAVDKARLSRLAGRLSRQDMRAIEAGLRSVLEL